MADADYSQIEYRVLTALAGNEWLAELFSDPDSDYHQLQASLMFGVDYAAVTGDMRKQAKSFNFGIPYGCEKFCDTLYKIWLYIEKSQATDGSNDRMMG